MQNFKLFNGLHCKKINKLKIEKKKKLKKQTNNQIDL